MSETISTLANLVAALHKLKNGRETGTVFVVSGNNRSAQISFEDGNIIQAFCQGKKGEKAFESIRQMEQVRYRFQPGAIPQSRVTLPVFEELIRFLENVPDSVAVVDESRKGTGTSISSVSPEQSLSEEQKKVLHDTLAEFIGPMATILCEEHFATVLTLEEALDAITGEIPSEQVSRFRNEVQRKIS